MTVIDQPGQAALVVARIRARQLPPPAERRRLRLAAGATLEDVADATGASVPTVSCWERGIYAPSKRYRRGYLEILEGFAGLEREQTQK
jgi:DNA-binding transcriptional regulator YiaG